MKTFTGWTYEPAATTDHGIPTAFTWTSPTGDQLPGRPPRLLTRTLTTPPHTPPSSGAAGTLTRSGSRSESPDPCR